MPSTALCQWCAQITFHDLPSVVGTREMYNLGAISRVKESPCPLCQLAAEADHRNAHLSDSVPTWLVWTQVPEVGFAFDVPQPGRNVCISFGLPQSTDDAVRKMRAAYPGVSFLTPTTESLIDPSRILSWVHNCEQGHGDRCQLPTQVPFAAAFRGMPFIRLIDVQDGCLVEKQHLVKYMALSYVWGAVDHLRLTKVNRPALLMPGSLNKVSAQLPRTILDAVTLVQRLGCRYLWVDALCLTQDDAGELDQGVGAMDLIYERAWLTIVAACGHDANAHLPGIQYGTRKPSTNTHHVMPGITMGLVESLDYLLGRSLYNTRGWTFQERILSRRAIYFVDDKLFYRCRRTTKAERLMDLPDAALPTHWTSSHFISKGILMHNPVVDYSWILGFYTQLILTNQSDAPRAMAGIIQRFSVAMGCQFLEGLPTATFDLFILLSRDGNNLRRRPSFPSYSWTGWSGPMSPIGTWYRMDFNRRLKDHTWIIWYKRSPSGGVGLVWDSSSELSFPFGDLRCVGYRERRSFSHGRYTPTNLDTSRTAPSEAISFSRDVPPYHILQFWTVSVFYTISDIDVFKATADLTDCNGAKCGSVSFDGFEETAYLESQACVEVILVSEPSFDTGPEPPHRTYRHVVTDHARVTEEPKEFYVLLLEWRGGLAERRGFGRITQEAMMNSLAPGPVWKEILLA